MTKTNDKIVLEMTPEQTVIVERAVELFFRLHIGQFEEIKWALRQPFNDTPTGNAASINTTLDFLRTLFFPKLRNGESNNIDINPDCTIAYNVFQAVRYVRAWYEKPEGGLGVNFDPPHSTGMPIPKCYVVKEGEIHEINGRDTDAAPYPYHR